MSSEDGRAMVCAYCGKDPGPRYLRSQLWNGFYDADSKRLVCYRCREAHNKFIGRRKSDQIGRRREYAVSYLTPLPPSPC